MSYNHILISVDLTNPNQTVIDKGVSLAKEANAKLSFIYVYTQYVNIPDTADTLGVAIGYDGVAIGNDKKDQQRLQKELTTLVSKLDYPVENTVVLMGNMEEELTTALSQLNADLLVCGQHHDFWSRLFSSSDKLVDSVGTDILIVYIK